MFILRLPFKLLALPLVAATSLLQWMGILLVSVSSTLINMLLGVVSMIVMASWMFGLTSAGNMTCGLTLCLILPQGFLAVGCAGQMDIVSAFLLCAALTLLDGEGHPLAAMLVYGAAAAMSGAAKPSELVSGRICVRKSFARELKTDPRNNASYPP